MQHIQSQVGRLLAVAMVVVGLAAACAPGPAAAPPAAPTAAPAASAGAATAEQQSWSQTLAAARQEGKVVVAGPPGQDFREAALEFRKQYPDIAVEYTGSLGRDIQSKMLAERRAGQYLWDVFINGAATAATLRQAGAFDPLRPALIQPDVLDSDRWLGGFDAGFMDDANQYVYGFIGYLSTNVLVNRAVVPESELSSIEQLREPRWRGRISWHDPRESGSGSELAGYWLSLRGEDWVRQFWQEQEVAITRDPRQQVEWVIQNRYPVAIGPGTAAINEFREQGFERELGRLEPTTPLGSRLTVGFGNVMVVNRAPHPAAAKVYVNWLLSAEGQAAWARITELNSRRLDVPGRAETAPNPSVDYLVTSKEDFIPVVDRAKELAKTTLR